MEKVITTVVPNDAQLNALERVWLVDNVVGESPIGTGEMPVLVIGETENGQTYRKDANGVKRRGGGTFSPLQVYGAADYYAKFGRLGFTTEAGPSRGAVARRSGGNVAWNGNLYIALAGWKFSTLIVGRVDNSAGSVTFRRHAAIRGGIGPFDLEPADTVTFQRNGVTNVVITWSAVAAQIVGIGGTYPTLFVGGETLVVQVDDDSPLTIYMTSAEQTLVNVIDRINAVAAATIAANVGGELALNSVVRGKAGRIRILGGTALATLGLVSTPVQNVWTWTVNAATSGAHTLRLQLYVNGVLTNYDATYTATVPPDTTTDIRDNLLANGSTGFNDLNVPGVTFTAGGGDTLVATGAANVKIISATIEVEPVPGNVTVAETTPGQYTDQYGTGNVNNIDDIPTIEAAAVIAAGSNITAYVDAQGYLWVADTGTPLTGTIQATAGVYADLGFDNTLSSAATGDAVTIPAGTRVTDSTTGTVWCTLEDYETDLTGGGFDLKVRPFEDIDTALPSLAASIDTVNDMPTGYWSVTNAASVTRLSKTQLDVRYKDALERSLDANSAASQARIVMSARSSANIDAYLVANAKASAEAGTLSARRAIFGPPVGTSIETAVGDDPLGVGANRDNRRIYVFPGIRKTVDEIANATSSAGIGFADDGVVETPATAMYAFMRARLPAERSVGENPATNEIGALTSYGLAGLESAYDSTQGGTSLTSSNYVQFKAKGITAINRIPGIGYLFQSDLASVDPTIDLARSPASRGFLFDELAERLWRLSIPYKAKLTRETEVQALLSQIRGYLAGLKSEAFPDRARIFDYQVSLESSAAQIRQGILIFKVTVYRFPHVAAIVYNVNLTPATFSLAEAA